MAVVEHDGTISLANTVFLNLLGYRRDDVENRKNIFDVLDEHVRDQKLDYHRRRLAGDTTVPHRYETQVVTSEGKILDVIVIVGLFPGTTQSVASIIDITDRKRMEDELRLFKASSDNAYDEIFWLDFCGSLLYVNDAATRNTGYSREELLAMKIFALDPDFTPDRWDGFMEELRRTGSMRFETRHRRKNRETMDVEVVANYVTKDDHEYSFAFVRDITKRKRMEEELRLFKASVDHANDEIFWFSFDAGILYVNDAAMRVTGYAQEELLAMNAFDLNPHISPEIWAGFMERLRKEGSLRFETGHRRKNGEIMDVEVVANYVTKGSTEYSIAFVRDITDRKRVERDLIHKNEELNGAYEQLASVEQELRRQFDELARSRILLEESEARFHGVFNNANDGIYIHQSRGGAPGRFMEVNDFLCSALGYTREELLAMDVKDVLSQAQQERAPDIDKVIAERGYNTFYSEFRRKDGSTFPGEVNVRRYQFSGEEVILAVARDITERRRAEQDLRQKNEELNTAYDQLGFR